MFIVGQQVVCINDEFPEWAKLLYKELPQKDHCYTVRQVMLGASSGSNIPTPNTREEDVAVLLEEILNPEFGSPPNEAGFLATRFVPLVEMSEEEILNVGEELTV